MQLYFLSFLLGIHTVLVLIQAPCSILDSEFFILDYCVKNAWFLRSGSIEEWGCIQADTVHTVAEIPLVIKEY